MAILAKSCSQERSYTSFWDAESAAMSAQPGVGGGIGPKPFSQYTTVHRQHSHELRNVARFFGYLFVIDVLPWSAMSCIHVNK